jgi:hypothetical protein
VNSRGGSLDGHNIQRTFVALIAAAGIQAPAGRRAPRLHDLRHTFTVATMLDFYRDGANVQARLPLLPHGSATSTRSRPTGISRPSPNCSPWRSAGSSPAGRATP